MSLALTATLAADYVNDSQVFAYLSPGRRRLRDNRGMSGAAYQLQPIQIQSRQKSTPSRTAQRSRSMQRSSLALGSARIDSRRLLPRTWPASMTYLERRYPNEFALRTVNREQLRPSNRSATRSLLNAWPSMVN